MANREPSPRSPLCPRSRPRGTGTDRVIRWSTAAVVVGVAAVAAYVSYQHAYELVAAHGESGPTARLVPATVDGLVYASSMVLWHSARHNQTAPRWARGLLILGIVATIGANVFHGLGHGPIGIAVAAWPAIALVGSYELLMFLVRGGVPATVRPEVRSATTPYDAGRDTRTIPATTGQPPVEESQPLRPVPVIEYDQYDEYGEYEHQNDHGDGETTDVLLARAKAVADEYWRAHARWITRDELRERLRCSSERATELLRLIKTANPPHRTDDQDTDE